MATKTTNKFSSEVRTSAVRMVKNHGSDYPSEYMQQARSVSATACKDCIALAGKLVDCSELPANAPSTLKMLARVMLENGEATFTNIVFDKVQLSLWKNLAAVAIIDAITV